MAATVNVNGRVFDQEHAVISVFDHGFLYGEGVYETLRTYNGQPFLFDRHMRRLRNSAGMLALAVPLTDARDRRALPRDDARGRTRRRTDREAYLRILVTRGIGELTYDPAACPTPSIVVIVKPHVEPPDGYLRAAASRWRWWRSSAIIPARSTRCIKSNNLLNNALAMQEAVRRGAFEGVMRNYRGELAECTHVQPVHRQERRRADAAARCRPAAGITREFLFEVGAASGIPVREAVLKDADLFDADEAFLTSTTREIVPIVRVDERVIGSGLPGPLTNGLLDAFRKKAQELS